MAERTIAGNRMSIRSLVRSMIDCCDRDTDVIKKAHNIAIRESIFFKVLSEMTSPETEVEFEKLFCYSVVNLGAYVSEKGKNDFFDRALGEGEDVTVSEQLLYQIIERMESESKVSDFEAVYRDCVREALYDLDRDMKTRDNYIPGGRVGATEFDAGQTVDKLISDRLESSSNNLGSSAYLSKILKAIRLLPEFSESSARPLSYYEDARFLTNVYALLHTVSQEENCNLVGLESNGFDAEAKVKELKLDEPEITVSRFMSLAKYCYNMLFDSVLTCEALTNVWGDDGKSGGAKYPGIQTKHVILAFVQSVYPTLLKPLALAFNNGDEVSAEQMIKESSAIRDFENKKINLGGNVGL